MAPLDDLPRAAELRGAVRLSERGLSFMLEGGARWPRARRSSSALARHLGGS